MFLSNVRDSTEVMGLKSHGCDGLLTFGTGVIMAIFHCLGTTHDEGYHWLFGLKG